ncbi:endonuclease/exonuclease/phosphatase family protein [Pelagicoccus albus]|uniref:Endonuclease/exonuclease/phosphatase family protein n=1 Tax=Pelagicoccus albus TaxID=415222 RepID=A0A7X1BAK4_9BACT|nr:endonuclease/exonuclease/phosphatase family protein [Pelagicoccus albus]MBC2607468.1 endonuclease/exonuclease/phosphatase family protein [Pelagicoccus albus]
MPGIRSLATSRLLLVALVWTISLSATYGEPRLRVATYNLRNYLCMDRVVEGEFRVDYPKPEAEKERIRQTILSVRPDILVVQEIGGDAMLEELQLDLAREGLRYHHRYVLVADDSTRMLGALWKEELQVQPVPHVDLEFSLFGEQRKVKRGLLELQISAPGQELLSLFTLHLKSKYTSDKRDYQSEERRAREAEAARDRILDRCPNFSESRLLLMGDLNDYRSSAPLRRFLSKGDEQLFSILEAKDESGLVWTHFYRKDAAYTLIDYILVSPGFEETYAPRSGIHQDPDFFAGSDHRLVWVDLSLN